MTEGIRAEGLDEVTRGLQQLIPNLMEWLDKRTHLGAGRIIQRTSKYPPPIPTSTYERTGKYGTTFTLRRIGQARQEMSSNARQRGGGYSPFVGGGEDGAQQATIHAGRWPVFRDETETEATDITMELKTEALREIGRLKL